MAGARALHPRVVLLSVVLGAASAGATTALRVSSGAGEPAPADAARLEARLADGVAELRASYQALRQRLERLEDRAPAGARAGRRGGTSLEAFERKVRAAQTMPRTSPSSARKSVVSPMVTSMRSRPTCAS